MLTQSDLHPYQRDAVRWLLDTPRAHLFAGMGAGKTVIVMTAVAALLLADEIRCPLVVGPKRVARDVWPHEPQQWAHLSHLSVQPILGTPQQRERAASAAADLYAINVENLPWLVEHWGRRWPYDYVIVDESTRLKKPSGKRFRAARRIHKLTTRWTNLSGTPAPNGLLDLWAPTYLLDSGARLGTAFTRFRDHYFASDYMGYRYEPRDFAEADIHAAVSDVTLSLRAEDYIDIREPVHHTLRVALPDSARRQYRELERNMVLQLEGVDVEAANAAVLTGKCRQLASGALYTDEHGGYETVHAAKIEALQSVIEEAAGESVLVAYHFRSTATRLLSAIPGARMLDHSPQTLDDWNAGRIPVLLAHPASAGHGLSLQHGGRRVVFFDADWDLELYQQIIERVGPVRQAQSGYDRAVYITHLAAADTIDEDVIDRRRGKATVQEALQNAMRRHFSGSGLR